MKKKIVVTGAAGFIGSHVCDELLLRGYRVVGVDNLSMGKIENIEHNFSNPGFDFEKIDVQEKDLLVKICGGAEKIVHLSAYKIPRYGGAADTLLINSRGMLSVLEAARITSSKVVFASTSDVYGKNPEVPFSESSDLVIGPSYIPRWGYAASKIFDEHLCYAYCREYDIPIVILRYFGSYGPRQHLSWWSGPVSVFISAVFGNECMEIHGNGLQTRTFLYISDLVEGTVKAIETDKANGEIFNIGRTREINILDLAHLIKKLTGTPGESKIKFVPYSAFGKEKYEDVMRRVPDITKAKKLLGFEPKVSLEDGLVRTIKWQKQVMQK